MVESPKKVEIHHESFHYIPHDTPTILPYLTYMMFSLPSGQRAHMENHHFEKGYINYFHGHVP